MHGQSQLVLGVCVLVVYSTVTSPVTSRSTVATPSGLSSDHRHVQLQYPTSAGPSSRSAVQASSKHRHRYTVHADGETRRPGGPMPGGLVVDGRAMEPQDRSQRAAHEKWLLEQTKQRILLGLGRFPSVNGASPDTDSERVRGDSPGDEGQPTSTTSTSSSSSLATGRDTGRGRNVDQGRRGDVQNGATSGNGNLRAGRNGARQQKVIDPTAEAGNGWLPMSQGYDIILNAEIAPANATEGEIQFRLNGVGRSTLNIISATLHVLVRHRKHSGTTSGLNASDANTHRQKPTQQDSKQAARGQDRGNRITIYVYQIVPTATKPDVSDVIGTTGSDSPAALAPIAQLTANVHRTKMQRLLLPTTVVQGLIDAGQPVLRLRVVCQACGGNTALVLGPSVPKQRRRHRRRSQNRRIGEEMPYLVLRVKERVPTVATTALVPQSKSAPRSSGRSLRQRV